MTDKNRILLDHGSGGLATQELITQILLPALYNPLLAELEDSAVIEPFNGRIAYTTDSYVVDPIFFPGGDIGSLAVNGTINDLAMRGARPLYLSVGLILEEGFAMKDLQKIVKSISKASKAADVKVVTGDTKVVPTGKVDKIFINTSGIGMLPVEANLSSNNARPGDVIMLSGTLADHGITILNTRLGNVIEGNIKSDTMALHRLVQTLFASARSDLHTLRDPTRGGIATCLIEIAGKAGVSMVLDEQKIPIKREVKTACELLGLDPLYLANEGKCVFLVAPDSAESALQAARSCSEGREAAIVGKVTEGAPGHVTMKTTVGGTRVISPLSGEPLPRIC